MIFSYASGLEDVVLRRAFHKVRKGSYLEIVPDGHFDLVGRSFQEKGWTGVVAVWTPLGDIPANGPKETKNQTPRMLFSVVEENPGTHLAIANGHEGGPPSNGDGYQKSTRIAVHSLGQLLSLQDGNVCWMRVAANGAEADLLAGWGSSEIRPAVVLMDRDESAVGTDFYEWEAELTDRGYKFVFRDGACRFYVHSTARTIASFLEPALSKQGDFVFPSSVALDKAYNRELADAYLAKEREISLLNSEIRHLSNINSAWEAASKTTSSTYEDARRSIELEQGKAYAKIAKLEADLRKVEADLRKVEADLLLGRKMTDSDNQVGPAQSATKVSIDTILPDSAELLSKLARLEDAVRRRQHQIADLQKKELERLAEREDLASSVTRAEREVADLRQELSKVYQSSSWKVTRPARMFVRLVHRARLVLANITNNIATATNESQRMMTANEAFFSLDPDSDVLTAWKEMLLGSDQTLVAGD